VLRRACIIVIPGDPARQAVFHRGFAHLAYIVRIPYKRLPFSASRGRGASLSASGAADSRKAQAGSPDPLRRSSPAFDVRDRGRSRLRWNPVLPLGGAEQGSGRSWWHRRPWLQPSKSRVRDEVGCGPFLVAQAPRLPARSGLPAGSRGGWRAYGPFLVGQIPNLPAPSSPPASHPAPHPLSYT
jgi:hypothetical protein